jgi:transposase-like protein
MSQPRPRRSFTPDFKAEIVELCRGNRLRAAAGGRHRLADSANHPDLRDWLPRLAA